MDKSFVKTQKKLFLGHFGPNSPKLGKTEFFQKHSGSISFLHLWTPNFIQEIKKML